MENKVKQRDGIPCFEDVARLFRQSMKASPEQIGEVKLKIKDRVIRAAENGQDHVLISVDSLAVGKEKTHPSWWSAIRAVLERYSKDGYFVSYSVPVRSSMNPKWEDIPPQIDLYRAGVIRVAWMPQPGGD